MGTGGWLCQKEREAGLLQRIEALVPTPPSITNHEAVLLDTIRAAEKAYADWRALDVPSPHRGDLGVDDVTGLGTNRVERPPLGGPAQKAARRESAVAVSRVPERELPIECDTRELDDLMDNIATAKSEDERIARRSELFAAFERNIARRAPGYRSAGVAGARPPIEVEIVGAHAESITMDSALDGGFSGEKGFGKGRKEERNEHY